MKFSWADLRQDVKVFLMFQELCPHLQGVLCQHTLKLGMLLVPEMLENLHIMTQLLA
jgi:hypothetical protein